MLMVNKLRRTACFLRGQAYLKENAHDMDQMNDAAKVCEEAAVVLADVEHCDGNSQVILGYAAVSVTSFALGVALMYVLAFG